jgi:Uma2 family endonuclease
MPQETQMSVIATSKPARMSRELFRAFVEGRPDDEHWELIDGVAMMMAPPTMAHQRIASNLERLLLDALETSVPHLTAFVAIGVDIGPAIQGYDPEPDVVVTDADAGEKPGERYAERFYLVAEVVSSSDRVDIERKRDVYRLHETCRCVLIIQQERFEIRVDRRTNQGWTDSTLTSPDDLLVLADFGLRCKVADIYRGTPLLPRRAQRS